MRDVTARPEPSDEALLSATAGGSREAFAELFRRRHRDVYRFALHLAGDPALADDVTQDTFILVMRDAARFVAGRATVTAWVCGIARNCCRQRLDRERRFEPLSEDDAGDTRQANSDPIGSLTRAEDIERLREAVLRLPLHYREVVVLCDLQEMSYTDAALAVGCSVGTIRSRLHRGRELLAVKLAGRAQTERAVPGGARCLA
jgi:RNA polymerase sigma-70 factor, ECF subfamily